MKRLMLGLTGLTVLSLTAVAADGVKMTWFDETFEKWKVSSTGDTVLKTGAGRWTRNADDRSAISTEGRKLSCNTRGTELVFKPCTTAADGYASTTEKKSPDNALARIEVKDAVFTAYRGGEEWDYVDTAPLGGLAMRKHDAGDCTFIGWVSTRDSSSIKGRWLELSAAGLEARENVAYAVTIESDNRCVPVRIRYWVDGRALKDKDGREWFSIRKGSLAPSENPKNRVSTLCFNGKGEVGEIRAETTALPEARADVTLNPASLPRPQVGAEVAFAVTPHAGVELGASLAYRWYLTDSAGMEVVGSDRGAAARYTLTADDSCHWVSVDVSDENGYLGTGRFWFSNLPVVYIDCKDAKGWVESDDETAAAGKVYYWADEDDRFFALATQVGEDLAPYREQHGKLFLEDVKTAWPTAKKEDHKAKIFITGNDEYKVQYDSDGQVEDGEEIVSKIHVRGNSTAGADKKPYKIKLGKKADLFGLGGKVKNKHWVLLANCFDESLMRNKLCYDLSEKFGLLSMKSTWVDVVMNGKYVGNYQLCQHIRVAEERVNIYDWSSAYEKIASAAQKANDALTGDDVDEIEGLLEEKQQGWMTDGRFTYLGTNYQVVAKGTEGPVGDGGFTVVWKNFTTDVSGGYIYELDSKKAGSGASSPAPSQCYMTRSSSRGALNFALAMNTPEFCFANAAVSNRVCGYWADVGDAWVSGTGYDSKGRHYTELCDFDSMVGYWLAMFVPGNNDAGSFSRYAYQDQGGKVVFGPAWDFDYGLGSLQIRVRSAAITNEYGEATYAPIAPTGWIPGRSGNNFMGYWTADPYFSYRLREKYLATRSALDDIVKPGGLIDEYKSYLGASARANDLRWNNRIGFWGNAEETGDVETLREFLSRRFAWLDEQFGVTKGDLGSALVNLTETVSSSNLRYKRTATVAAAVAGATPVAEAGITSVSNVAATVKLTAVAIAVAVPVEGAAKLDVYLNGLSNRTVAVAAKAASVEIPADDLRFGEKNFLEFRAKKADGTFLASNVALLKASLPEKTDVGEGEGQVPVAVEISWLEKSWAKLVEAKAVDSANTPKTYSQQVAFAKSASPVGKPMTLWEEYVADTDPADSNDVFTASIEMAGGVPRVVWSPDRSDKGGAVVRGYTLRGANDVTTPAASWESLKVDGADDVRSEAFRKSHRFFKVEVSLPDLP